MELKITLYAIKTENVDDAGNQTVIGDARANCLETTHGTYRYLYEKGLLSTTMMVYSIS